MRKCRVLVAGAALLMSTAGAAANGDGDVDSPPEPPPASDGAAFPTPPPPERAPQRYDWSGLYGGVQGGWLWGEDEVFEIRTLGGFVNDGPLVYDTDGYAVGGLLGVNLQSGNWVYGLELDVEYTDVEGQWIWPTSGNILTKEMEIASALRLRAGFALDRILLYAAAGLAVGNVHMTAVDIELPELRTISGDDIGFGYTYGGGVEVAVGGNWSAGVEYRYSDRGDTEHNGEIFETVHNEEIIIHDFTYPHTNKSHAVRARLIYRLSVL